LTVIWFARLIGDVGITEVTAEDPAMVDLYRPGEAELLAPENTPEVAPLVPLMNDIAQAAAVIGDGRIVRKRRRSAKPI
jgi:hypothetical protein